MHCLLLHVVGVAVCKWTVVHVDRREKHFQIRETKTLAHFPNRVRVVWKSSFLDDEDASISGGLFLETM